MVSNENQVLIEVIDNGFIVEFIGKKDGEPVERREFCKSIAALIRKVRPVSTAKYNEHKDSV